MTTRQQVEVERRVMLMFFAALILLSFLG